MAPKTIKAALRDALDDLSDDNFKKFCSQLLDRREEPRVRRNRVENKSRWEVADVLVSHFTEAGVLQVAADILTEIGCSADAQTLAEYNKEAGGSKPGASQTKHFVDKNQVELKKRVTNMGPILDELLDEGVIQQEVYDRIRALSTPQEKMRELYSGPLRASEECKDAFYKILVKNEPYLVRDLEK